MVEVSMTQDDRSNLLRLYVHREPRDFRRERPVVQEYRGLLVRDEESRATYLPCGSQNLDVHELALRGNAFWSPSIRVCRLTSNPPARSGRSRRMKSIG